MFASVRIHALRLLPALTFVFAPSAYPSLADDLVDHLGPAANGQPVLTNVGSKRVVAFYSKSNSRCALHAVAWEKSNSHELTPQHDPAGTAVRVRISLNPGQTVHIDTPDQDTLNLRCGRNAETLEVVEEREYVAFGIATPGHLKADLSAF